MNKHNKKHANYTVEVGLFHQSSENHR